MALIRSHALILQKIPYSESSLIFKTFTRESGLITLIAKGAGKPKSKFQGLLDFFSIYELIYRTKSQDAILTLSDASLVADFPGIKQDLHKQSLANVLLETFLRHLYGPEPCVPLFENLKDNLEALDSCKSAPFNYPLLLCDFWLQFCGFMGFQPQFSKCIHCHAHAPERAFACFDLDMGGPVCRGCEQKSRECFRLVHKSLTGWLHQVQTAGMAARTISGIQMASAEELLMSFMYHHTGRRGKLKSYTFYRKMILSQ